MTREFCPKCRALQEMSLARTTRVVKTKPGGKDRRVETVSYHCRGCGTFVRSEEKPAESVGER